MIVIATDDVASRLEVISRGLLLVPCAAFNSTLEDKSRG